MQVLEPSPATLKLIQKARSAVVSLLVGSEPIGGIDAAMFRENEGLCRSPRDAAKEMQV